MDLNYAPGAHLIKNIIPIMVKVKMTPKQVTWWGQKKNCLSIDHVFKLGRSVQGTFISATKITPQSMVHWNKMLEVVTQRSFKLFLTKQWYHYFSHICNFRWLPGIINFTLFCSLIVRMPLSSNTVKQKHADGVREIVCSIKTAIDMTNRRCQSRFWR